MGQYVKTPLEEARCPECGNEDGNVRQQRQGNAQPVPDGSAVGCPECGHRDSTLAFRRTYEWERLDEEERRQKRQAQERRDEQMVGWQHSAQYHSVQRE